MTFGVVLLSIVIQGITAEPLLRALKLVGNRSERSRFEASRGDRLAIGAALDALVGLEREGLVRAEVASELRTEYEGRTTRLADCLLGLDEIDASTPGAELRTVRRRLWEVEKGAVSEAYRNGLIDGESRDRLLREIAARRLAR
jgi:CPA1 family monovalent cation:H+ antiporter